jgi:hypothetical protein
LCKIGQIFWSLGSRGGRDRSEDPVPWGARGIGIQVYFRDPEGNLVEAREYKRHDSHGPAEHANTEKTFKRPQVIDALNLKESQFFPCVAGQIEWAITKLLAAALAALLQVSLVICLRKSCPHISQTVRNALILVSSLLPQPFLLDPLSFSWRETLRFHPLKRTDTNTDHHNSYQYQDAFHLSCPFPDR